MKSVKPILKSLSDKGFSHLKVELEAQLNRSYRYTCHTEPCASCTSGIIRCTSCNDTGAVTSERPGLSSHLLLECAACLGRGHFTCQSCQGSSIVRTRTGHDWSSASYCQSWILENVSPAARAALNYAKFYYDGSVDSEMTFTLPIGKGEHIVEFIEAFKKMSEEIGSGIDTDGAGMHIAVMKRGCRGKYPVTTTSLDGDKLDNFITEVTKLMPAMFLLASASDKSRPYRYRIPRISNDKYSAIHILRGCLEFRLFETCYERPTAVYEFLGVMDRALEFYHDPSKKVERIGVDYPFIAKKGTSKFVETVEQVRVIKKQLKYVVPKDTTIKEIQLTRGVKVSIGELNKKEKERLGELRRLFQEHVRAYTVALERPLSQREKAILREIRQENRTYNFGMTEQQMKARAMGISLPILNEEEFIRQNTPRLSADIKVRT